MAFCTKCGADASGARFCPKCGSPMGASSGSGTEPGAGGYAPGPGASHSGPQSEGLPDNAAGALAYFTIIPAIIFLVIDPFKTRRFVRFHCFQCLFLCAFAFIVWFGLVTLTNMLGFFGFGLWGLLQLGFFVVWLIVVIKAYQGEEFRLPILGDLAAKQV